MWPRIDDEWVRVRAEDQGGVRLDYQCHTPVSHTSFTHQFHSDFASLACRIVPPFGHDLPVGLHRSVTCCRFRFTRTGSLVWPVFGRSNAPECTKDGARFASTEAVV
jgi:hypothetical protein